MPTPESPENLEARREALFEKLQLREQYELQLQMLNETGALEILPESQEMGVIGIDGKEYPVPTLKEIKERIQDSEKIELLEKKHSQGFTRLLLVPHAIPTSVLGERYGQLVSRKVKEGKMKTSKGEPIDEVAEDGPLHCDSGLEVYPLMYYPDSMLGLSHYSKGNEPPESPEVILSAQQTVGGKTKKELIDDGDPWAIMMVEDSIEAPRVNSEQTTNGRTQFPAGLPTLEYFTLLKQDPQYRGEQGLTVEAWLVMAMTILHEKDIQIDCWSQEDGPSMLLVGSFFAMVPEAFWHNKQKQGRIRYIDFDETDPNHGARSSVLI
ncbi:hypothetical protein ACFL2D_00820 [Patescibacteria group bacterium]